MPIGIPAARTLGDLLTVQQDGSFAPAGFTLAGAYTFTAAQTIAVSSAAEGLVLNYNTSAAAPAPLLTGGMQIVGADATSPFLEIDMFGTGNGGFLCRKARGTNLSRLATNNGDILLQFQSRGYDGSAYAVNEAGSIRISCAEATTSTAQGGVIGLFATRVGSTTVDPVAAFYSQATGIPTVYIGSSANPCGISRNASNALQLFTNALGSYAVTIDTAQLVGLSVTPTAGNGLLQRASGTTRASGDAWGTDTFLFRDAANSLLTEGALRSKGSSGGIGYATGAGSTVTQITSRTTGVTINAVCGDITLVLAAGSAAYTSFTVTNSAVAATDQVTIQAKTGTDRYAVFVTAVAAGSFTITFADTSGTTTEQPVFHFAVIKAVNA